MDKKPEALTWVVMDADGVVLNNVIWDGVTPWTALAEQTVQRMSEYLALRGEDPAKIKAAIKYDTIQYDTITSVKK